MIHPYYKAPPLVRLQRSGQLRIIIAYLVAGFATASTDYLAFLLFYQVFPTGLFVATIIAYIAGLVVSFVLYRFWVFRQQTRQQQFGSSLVRYLVLLTFNLFLTYAILWGLEAWFGLTPLLGKFVVGFFMTFWIYVADKLWVFTDKPKTPWAFLLRWRKR